MLQWRFKGPKHFENGSKSCEKYQTFNFELNYLDQIQAQKWEMNYFTQTHLLGTESKKKKITLSFEHHMLHGNVSGPKF